MNKIKSLVLFVMVLGLANCANPNIGSGNGFGGYVKESVASTKTSNREVITVGTACAHNWIGAVSIGDASIAQAIKNGDIKTPVAVDREIKNFGGLYARSCTLVSGY